MSYRWGHIKAISRRTDKYAYDSYNMTKVVALKQEFKGGDIMRFMHYFGTSALFWCNWNQRNNSFHLLTVNVTVSMRRPIRWGDLLINRVGQNCISYQPIIIVTSYWVFWVVKLISNVLIRHLSCSSLKFSTFVSASYSYYFRHLFVQ